MWASAPPLPAYGTALLDAYLVGRGAAFPALPGPDWKALVQNDLAPAVSGSGADGEPYEVYHLGTRFVACLLGRALHAATIGEAELDAALGPSVDLLVWILNYERAEDPAGMRPHPVAQLLPTDLRRRRGGGSWPAN